MSKNLTREECLLLDISLYNEAMKVQWKKDKIKKNLSGDLHDCKHCGRKYVICCICDEAEKRWTDFINEVIEVSNKNNNIKY
jgi:hypothetical protein